MSVKAEKIIIGTRGSALAMWQAQTVADKIANIGHNIEVEINKIKTSGDWKPCQGERKLDAAKGGKALFAKEIEESLLAGEIDLAVHSMKDLESDMPEGLIVPWVLPRSDARDAFLSSVPGVVHPKDLPRGSVVGTASIRRQAFLLRTRPDLKIVTIRGNVNTRIDKLRAGQVDATLLAIAGLERLGFEAEALSILSVEEMLPAAGQGAIGVQIRQKDHSKLSYIGQINCYNTNICVKSEREVLCALGGTCHTPIGVYATFESDTTGQRADGQGGVLKISAQVVSPDGKEIWEKTAQEHVLGLEEACTVGHSIGTYLKGCVPASVLG